MRRLALIASHVAMLALGFALGVYLLPILTAPKGPASSEIEAAAAGAMFKGNFDKGLKGSDFLHWGEGEVMIGRERIVHRGRLAPGPDYKVYLTKSFVDTKEGFLAIKSQSLRVGDVKTFDGFIVELPPGTDPAAYSAVVVWCEAFSQFITAAKYR